METAAKPNMADAWKDLTFDELACDLPKGRKKEMDSFLGEVSLTLIQTPNLSLNLA